MITPGGELDRPVFRSDDGIQAFHVNPWVGIGQCEGAGAVLTDRPGPHLDRVPCKWGAKGCDDVGRKGWVGGAVVSMVAPEGAQKYIRTALLGRG